MNLSEPMMRVSSRFFVQACHKSTYESCENKHFFTVSQLLLENRVLYKQKISKTFIDKSRSPCKRICFVRYTDEKWLWKSKVFNLSGGWW